MTNEEDLEFMRELYQWGEELKKLKEKLKQIKFEG